MARAAKPYHHGDLRRALLRAAEAELTEKGIDGFTLRGCARRAGVSHAAPAHHFGNAAGLLAALAEDAFSRLAAAMRAEMALAVPGSRAFMAAAARGYLRFALDNTGLFQVIFRLQGATSSDSRVRAAGQAAFGLAAQSVAAYYGVDDAMDDRGLAPRVIGLWALAHGLADLALARQFGAPAEARALVEDVLEQMLTMLPERDDER